MHLDLLSIPQSGGKNVKTFMCVTPSNNKDESNTIIATRTEDHDDVESSYQVHDPVIHLEVDEEQ